MKIIKEHEEFTLCTSAKMRLAIIFQNGKVIHEASMDNEKEMDQIKSIFNEIINGLYVSF